MDKESPYYRAHLTAAAARILLHRNGAPPTAEDIARELAQNVEDVHHTVNGLVKMGVLETVSSAVGDRIFVADPRPMEDLPRERQAAGMEKDLEKFAAEKKAALSRIESLAKGEAGRKKDLFAAISEQLKEQVKKGRT